MGFYITSDFHYISEPISNFVSTNSLESILDSNMNFVTSGSYLIRYTMNLRPRLTANIILKCSNSSLEQTIKTEATIYKQISWEGLVYFEAGQKLEFYFKTLGDGVYVVPDGDLRVMNSVLFAQLISTQNVLV